MLFRSYFLLGALSSGIFLYGTALLYGFAGGFSFALIDARVRIQVETPMLLFTGMTLVIVGVLFKLGTVPFHNWVPDVYCGAPSPVTAFMAVCTKIAAAFGLLRLLFTALGGMVWDWQVPIAMVAVLELQAWPRGALGRRLREPGQAQGGLLLGVLRHAPLRAAETTDRKSVV